MFEDEEKVYEQQKAEKLLEDRYGKPLKVNPKKIIIEDFIDNEDEDEAEGYHA